ncbi:hypothetical protein [[Flexibacter] sp. ATCC 35208]|uniref:hypothetical protein n=1 Tax=[Flexibacter] sp. ATCC 35208 TaxID=1936242 RepID=UPI0009C56A74|nr:hypothetical protein [[Flexibacter] sp. ATCC 35208]OMP80137.1 hypothetical protein BW716_06490 [[Flexibacter] sp. ATCC 35208]
MSDLNNTQQLILVPVKSLEEIFNRLSSIEILLKEKTPGHIGKVTTNAAAYITAQSFMDAVGIKRTKFSKLIKENKIKTIKKMPN